MANSVEQTGLKSFEMCLLINKGQRAFNELLKTCLGHHGLTIPQWSLLGTLYKGGSIRPSKVAEALGVKPPFTTTVINALEAAGFVSTAPFPDDERGKQIVLTDAGHTLVKTVEVKLAECLNNQLGSLSSADLKTYFALSNFMAQNVHHH